MTANRSDADAVSTDSKIDLLDAPDVVAKKIKKAVAAPKVVEENGILAFVEYVLLPAAGLRGKREFVVERERDGLEPLIYSTVEQMHEDYRNDVVCIGIIESTHVEHPLTNGLAITTTAQGGSHKITKRALGPNPGGVPSLQGMAGHCPQGLPPATEEGEEGQGQGQPTSRSRESQRSANRRQGLEGGRERGVTISNVNKSTNRVAFAERAELFQQSSDCGIEAQGAKSSLEYPIYTEYMRLRTQLALVTWNQDLSPMIQESYVRNTLSQRLSSKLPFSLRGRINCRFM